MRPCPALLQADPKPYMGGTRNKLTGVVFHHAVTQVCVCVCLCACTCEHVCFCACGCARLYLRVRACACVKGMLRSTRVCKRQRLWLRCCSVCGHSAGACRVLSWEMPLHCPAFMYSMGAFEYNLLFDREQSWWLCSMCAVWHKKRGTCLCTAVHVHARHGSA